MVRPQSEIHVNDHNPLIMVVIPLMHNWTKIRPQDTPIDWLDRMPPNSRRYGHPGRLTVTDKLVTYGPDARQLTGVKYFGWFFIPIFSLTAFLFIPAPEKWIFVLAGPTVGTLTFGMIYYLIKQDVDAGAYIEYDRISDEIVLPRHDLRLDPKTVTLQWITGASAGDSDICTDLNLIVSVDDSKFRYYVMGGPYRKFVRQFIDHANVSVLELNMGWKGRRDIDSTSGE